jgi:cobalt transporter subunit CbtB
MRAPPFVVTYRSVTAALTALILASIILGFAGYGPLVVLHRAAHPLSHALHLDRISG